jgi:hypothetical protein
MNQASLALCYRALLWVLIGLVPIQGLAAGVFATLGPAHVHRAADVVQIELEDFRRSPMRLAPRDTHVSSVFGHFHSVEPSRHHHQRSDVTVVRVADDAANQIGDTDEFSGSLALTALTPVLPCVVTSLASALTYVMVSSDAWPLLTHDPKPLERPPRDA